MAIEMYQSQVNDLAPPELPTWDYPERTTPKPNLRTSSASVTIRSRLSEPCLSSDSVMPQREQG